MAGMHPVTSLIRQNKFVYAMLVGLGVYWYFHFGIQAPELVPFIRYACFGLAVALVTLWLRAETPEANNGEAADSDISDLAGEDDVLLRLSEDVRGNGQSDADAALEDQLRGIAETVNVSLVAKATSVYILDEARNVLIPKAHVAEDGRAAEPIMLEGDGADLAAVIYQGESRILERPASESMRSEMIVPITREDVVIGALSVRSPTVNAFSSDDGVLLSAFARLVTYAVVNFNNVRSYESSSRLFSSFYEISRELQTQTAFDDIIATLVNIVRKILKFDRFSIALIEENGQLGRIHRVLGQVDDFGEGCVFPLEDALNGWVMRRNKSALVQDLEHLDPKTGETFFRPRYTNQEKSSFGLRAFLAAPLSYQDKVIGVVTVESRTPGLYTNRHEQVLEMLANNVAAALERSIIAEQLKQMAVTDEMTGLNNFRAFQQRLTEEVLRAERYHNKFCLLIIDIDHFKRFNDTHGHLVGDEVLKHVTRLIRSTVRSIDFTARYGGEEFAAILLGNTLEAGRYSAERIRACIETTPLQVKNQQLSVTVSIGVAEFQKKGTTFQSLIEQADQALYRAKNGGRNQVALHEH